MATRALARCMAALVLCVGHFGDWMCLYDYLHMFVRLLRYVCYAMRLFRYAQSVCAVCVALLNFYPFAHGTATDSCARVRQYEEVHADRHPIELHGDTPQVFPAGA